MSQVEATPLPTETYAEREQAARAAGRTAAASAVQAIEAEAREARALRESAHREELSRATAAARGSIRSTWLASTFGVLAAALPVVAVMTAVPELRQIEEDAIAYVRDSSVMDDWLTPVSGAGAEVQFAVTSEADEEDEPATPPKIAIATRAPRAPKPKPVPALTPIEACTDNDAFDPMSFCLP